MKGQMGDGIERIDLPTKETKGCKWDNEENGKRRLCMTLQEKGRMCKFIRRGIGKRKREEEKEREREDLK